MQRTLSMGIPRSAQTPESCAVSKSPAKQPVSSPRRFLSSARSRMAGAVLTPPTCHRLSKESVATIFGSEWFSPRTRSPAVSPDCRPPANPAEIKTAGLLASSLLLRLVAAPAPIAPRSHTPTRSRGSCRARKHALSNSKAKAMAIMARWPSLSQLSKDRQRPHGPLPSPSRRARKPETPQDAPQELGREA